MTDFSHVIGCCSASKATGFYMTVTLTVTLTTKLVLAINEFLVKRFFDSVFKIVALI